MKIILKPEALEKLKRYSFKENEGVRVEAAYIASCSLYIEYSLKVEEKGEHDDLFMIEGIPVVVSKESQRLLEDTVILDYNDNLGYKLSSDEETYRYNLMLET
ncbi:iron-sulfur cluster biosynthesis family protein [Peribacillus kribbensis]|uniref:iron-sulfur cluster biosynthesis family protein n=1 Tax=Peribacillus kribbensis TaxID=356658 RepID=UPI000421EC2C|nr:iron-sulfur cluster biosynthesis family protein [Peribacillus kribbensis]